MKIKDLSHLSPEQKIEFILLQAEKINILEESINQLKAKIKMLEEKKRKNSRNSSKPPSSDQKKHEVCAENLIKNQVANRDMKVIF